MPQMAPLYWLLLLFWFLLALLLFFVLNYSLKPYEKKLSLTSDITPTYKLWKL
nr:ATPase F0 subunit 8 [Percnon planissimum]